MTLMSSLIEASHAVAAAAGGVTALLRRGSQSANLTVIITRPSSGVADKDNVLLQWQGVFVLCLAADYALDNEAVDPLPGDRLEVAALVYEVMSPDIGSPCFNYRNPPDCTLLRIHAKQVG
jgi:hypothetical protein